MLCSIRPYRPILLRSSVVNRAMALIHDDEIEKLNRNGRVIGKDGAAPKPINARQKNVAKRKPLDELPEEFVTLWNKIRLKTRYQVTVDTAN